MPYGCKKCLTDCASGGQCIQGGEHSLIDTVFAFAIKTVQIVGRRAGEFAGNSSMLQASSRLVSYAIRRIRADVSLNTTLSTQSSRTVLPSTRVCRRTRALPTLMGPFYWCLQRARSCAVLQICLSDLGGTATQKGGVQNDKLGRMCAGGIDADRMRWQ